MNFPPNFRSISNFDSYQRILGEYDLKQELFGEGNALDVLLGHVDELRLLVTTDIVIADVGVGFALDAKLVLLLGDTLSHEVVSDSHNTFLDKIHVSDFVLFI